MRVSSASACTTLVEHSFLALLKTSNNSKKKSKSEKVEEKHFYLKFVFFCFEIVQATSKANVSAVDFIT